MTAAERKELAYLRESVRDLYKLIHDRIDGIDFAQRDRVCLAPRRRLLKHVAPEISRIEARRKNDG